MTASSPVARTDIIADGTTAPLNTGFLIKNASHLQMYMTSPGGKPARQSDFSVANLNDPKGAQVSLTGTIPAAGTRITLLRDVPASDLDLYTDRFPQTEVIANGTDTDFNTEFLLRDETHVIVFVTETGQAPVQQTGFTVTGLNDISGATIQLQSPPAANAIVTIQRAAPEGAETKATGDGTNTNFNTGFLLRDAAHVTVFVTETEQAPVQQSGFTVTNINNTAGAVINLLSAPAAGATVTMRRADALSSYSDPLSFAPLPVEQALDPLFNATKDVLTMEMFGAVGDGIVDDSQAWQDMVAKADETGKTVLLASKTYLISGAVQHDLNVSHISIIGMGTPVLIGGTGDDSVTLFRTVRNGLTFHNIETRNICLINTQAGNALSDIDLIDIRNWTYDNSTGHSVILRIKHSTTPFKVKRLTLRDINGSGGFGGLSFFCPIETVDVDNYTVQNISVPDTDEHFKTEPGIYNLKDMKNTGYGDGLLLGDDDPDAQEKCQSWSIGRISISDIEDKRVPREDPAIETPENRVPALANCDGVRLMGQNMTIGQINVRRVRSAYQAETTGVYFKGRNSTIGTIYIENAGGHEAGCVFKGARRTNGEAAKGFNISVDTLKLFADDDEDRCAVYLGPDDIHIGFLSIEGYGGDAVREATVAPNDTDVLLNGSGPLVFCESTNKQRLHIGRYSIMNCKLGALSGDDPVELFSLRGYKEIKIGAGFIDEVSNDKHVDDPEEDTNFPDINVFHLTDSDNAQPVKSIEIGPLVATNFRTKNDDGSIDAKVTLFNLDTNTFKIDRFTVWNPIVDDTVNVGLRMRGVTEIGQIQIIGGDLSQCDPILELNGARPAISVLDCLGLATRNTPTTDNTAIRQYSIGSIRPSVVIDPVDDLYFQDGGAAPLSAIADFSRNIDSFEVRKDGGLSKVLKDLPRQDHHAIVDGIFQRVGMRIEKSATNKLNGSESFARAAWKTDEMSLASGFEVAPDGSNTAQKITEEIKVVNNINEARKNFAFQNFTAVSGEQTLSVYAKESGRNRLLLGAEFTSNQYKLALFDIENGVVLQDDTGITNGAEIVQLADGWYRCSIRVNVSIEQFAVGPFNADTISGNLWPKYIGTVDKGVLLWGPQMESGKRPTSFISTPTGNATEERKPDALEILASNMPSSSVGYVFVMKGFVTYEDSGNTEATILEWGDSGAGSTGLFRITLDTSGSATGQFNARLTGPSATTVDASSAIGTQLTPGVEVPFAVALQATPTSLRLFVNGTAGSAVSHTAGLPELTADNCEIAPDFAGSLTDARVFDVALSEALLTAETAL